MGLYTLGTPMAVSAQKISQDVLDDINLQHQVRLDALVTPDVIADIELQERLRSGDYKETSVMGAAQAVLGGAENVLQMVSGFASAVPGVAAGVGAALGCVWHAVDGPRRPTIVGSPAWCSVVSRSTFVVGWSSVRAAWPSSRGRPRRRHRVGSRRTRTDESR